jgi:rhodanese-related sulfurtransferase
MSAPVTPVTPVTLGTEQARTRLHEFTVIDVRTPAEYASGHLPGAVNIPLDNLQQALPDIRHAAGQGELLVVCASGARSENACRQLAGEGIRTATLSGGTGAWASQGNELQRPAACETRSTWSMERQVRFGAGSLVLIGVMLGFLLHPALLLVPAGVAAGLVYSAVTGTCAMAVVLGKLPHNRPRAVDLEAALAELRRR